MKLLRRTHYIRITYFFRCGLLFVRLLRSKTMKRSSLMIWKICLYVILTVTNARSRKFFTTQAFYTTSVHQVSNNSTGVPEKPSEQLPSISLTKVSGEPTTELKQPDKPKNYTVKQSKTFQSTNSVKQSTTSQSTNSDPAKAPPYILPILYLITATGFFTYSCLIRPMIKRRKIRHT